MYASRTCWVSSVNLVYTSFRYHPMSQNIEEDQILYQNNYLYALVIALWGLGTYRISAHEIRENF